MKRKRITILMALVMILSSSSLFAKSDAILDLSRYFRYNRTTIDTPEEYVEFFTLAQKIIDDLYTQPENVQLAAVKRIENGIIRPNKDLFVKRNLVNNPSNIYLGAVLDKVREISISFGPKTYLDKERRKELADLFSLTGSYYFLMVRHGVYLFDNGKGFESRPRIDAIVTIHAAVPAEIWNGRVFAAQWKANYPEVKNPATGKLVETNYRCFNSFWRGEDRTDLERFVLTYGHELAHQIDKKFIDKNAPQDRKDYYYATVRGAFEQAGTNDRKKWLYLLSRDKDANIKIGEFIAGLYTDFIHNGDTELKIALERYDQGYKQPLNQLVMMLNLNANLKNNISYFYEFDQNSGRVNAQRVDLTRDGFNITSFTYKNLTYEITYDSVPAQDPRYKYFYLVSGYSIKNGTSSEHDSYVRGGRFKDTNFSKEPEMWMKNPGNPNDGYFRQSYVKFDVGKINVKENTQVEMVIPIVPAIRDNVVDVYEVLTYWNERSITNSKKPKVSAPIAKIAVKKGQGTLRLDVTDMVTYAQRNKSNKLNLSFNVQSRGTSNYITAYTKENPSAYNRPRLEVTTAEMADERLPIADAFVIGGDSAKSNYGSLDFIEMQNPTNKNSEKFKEGYFKFSVKSFNANERLYLVLPTYKQGLPEVELELYNVDDNYWSQDYITFENRPNKDAQIWSQTIAKKSDPIVVFDVTNLFREAKKTDKILNMAINVKESDNKYNTYSSFSVDSKLVTTRPYLTTKNPLGNNSSLSSITESTNSNVLEPKVYPNPFVNEITIDLMSPPVGASYELFNFNGASILKGTLSNTVSRVQLPTLANGMYILKVKNNGEDVSVKIYRGN